MAIAGRGERNVEELVQSTTAYDMMYDGRMIFFIVRYTGSKASRSIKYKYISLTVAAWPDQSAESCKM